MLVAGAGAMATDCGLMGGYPGAAGYRFTAYDTDIKERIEKRLPLPLGADLDPDNPTYEKNMNAERIYRDRQAVTTQEEFGDYDVILNYLRGGPGFGDPIDRDPKLVERDLNDGLILPRYADKVYGVVYTEENGEYTVDLEATEKRRQEVRKERLERSVPTTEWMKEEKARIVNKEASKQVKLMFAESFALSEKFTDEFKAFWNLDEEWMVYEDELNVTKLGRHINRFKN